MLIKELPKKFSPAKLCKEAHADIHYSASIALGELRDLPPDLPSQNETRVHLSLMFGVDEAGFCCITGELQGDLQLICQRCLSPMSLSLSNPIKVSPVKSLEQAKALPKQYEPLLVDEVGDITLNEWLAEEIQLALPLVPRHDPPCKIETEDVAQPEDGKLNKFQDALLKLKDVK